ncbi:MAG TPA: hypothetical protein VFU98_06230, partial [Microlunatus sp.]|nr:hypothetical protein [Microlunatus sp.]
MSDDDTVQSGRGPEATEPAGPHTESDAQAPIKGAVPEGESEPDAGTRSESATGAPHGVASDETEAGEATQEGAVERAESTAEVIETRQGMFGVHGTGDTSGYGGLTRTIEFPAASQPPFGGWWDQVDDRIGQLLPSYSDVITKVVIHRGEITFHVERRHLAGLVQLLRD